MYLTADREGKIEKENGIQDRLLEWMYAHRAGRAMLCLFIRPSVSRMGGRILDSGVSRLLIRPFIRSHSINMDEYETKDFCSYNDFFKRILKPGIRSVMTIPDIFVSPCDSRLSVYRINGQEEFQVKHAGYTLGSLLRDRKLAEKFAGGYIWIFRLCVEDYHHYIYVDNGRELVRRRIQGVFHTVNPAAGNRMPVYKENTREYSVIKTENFGEVIQMEVGALLVGRIENRKKTSLVKRGQERGNFAFGGSTVILVTREKKAQPDWDILENSRQGIETRVKLGERVGKAGVTVQSFSGESDRL